MLLDIKNPLLCVVLLRSENCLSPCLSRYDSQHNDIHYDSMFQGYESILTLKEQDQVVLT